MSKLTELEKHKQLHEILPNEEVVHVTSVKGDPAQFKLNHEHRTVLMAGGPEEDALWKYTNASYDSIMALLHRAPNQPIGDVAPTLPPPVVEPIDMESVAPELPV